MPYWERQAITDRTLATYAKHYDPSEVEVVLVDDGSPTEPFVDRGQYANLRVARLPEKREAKTPTLPLNIGANYASHDTILLTVPEVRHEHPVIGVLYDYLEPDTVVSAKVWCESLGKWLVHGDADPVERSGQPMLPKGAALPFCMMLTRGLFRRVGGMDEDYRDGQGYDDTDLAMRLASAGVRWVYPQATVTHSRDHKPTEWVGAGLMRNRDVFTSKWDKETRKRLGCSE